MNVQLASVMRIEEIFKTKMALGVYAFTACE